MLSVGSSASDADQTDDSHSFLSSAPETRYGMDISLLTGSSGKGTSLFLLFLQGIISKARSFSAGNLGRRRRSEENNSEITAYLGRARLMVA